jgi:hypothetical protein
MRSAPPGVHPAPQPGAPVIADAQRLATAAGRAGSRPGPTRHQAQRADLPSHHGSKRRHARLVVSTVDERAEEHPVTLGEFAQQVERAQLVALVRRIGNPMRQEQQGRTRVHGHPRWRTIIGPSASASVSSSRISIGSPLTAHRSLRTPRRASRRSLAGRTACRLPRCRSSARTGWRLPRPPRPADPGLMPRLPAA